MVNDIIKKFHKIHNHKYTYPNLEYVNINTKITIKCPKHGDFQQTPQSHKKNGCPNCSKEHRLRKLKLKNLRKFKSIHNNFYNYNFYTHVNNSTNIKIHCPKHGIFSQSPKSHLKGSKCPHCLKDSMTLLPSTALKRLVKSHNSEYTYPNFNNEYENTHSIITINCSKHGNFRQNYHNHYYNLNKCPNCSNEGKKIDYDYFITKSKSTHGDKYIYPKQEINFNEKVSIICKKHGLFKQLPNNHYNLKHNCPKCKISKSEEEIENIFIKYSIEYIREYKIENCKYEKELPFDFYLPKCNLLIEYNGIQHYKQIEYFNNRDEFRKRIIKDNIKRKFVLENRYKYLIINYKDNIFKKIRKHVKEIK